MCPAIPKRFLDASAPTQLVDPPTTAPAAARFAAEIASAPENNAVPSKPAVMNEYNATEIAGVEESATPKSVSKPSTVTAKLCTNQLQKKSSAQTKAHSQYLNCSVEEATLGFPATSWVRFSATETPTSLLPSATHTTIAYVVFEISRKLQPQSFFNQLRMQRHNDNFMITETTQNQCIEQNGFGLTFATVRQ